MNQMLNRKTKVTAGAALGAALMALGIASFSASSAVAAGAACPNANDSLDSMRGGDASKAFICLFNEQRSSDVKKNGDLAGAAQAHSNKMRRENCLEHKCQGEQSLRKRVAATGYLNGSEKFELGEVLAFGVDKSPNDIFDKWLQSSDHRALIKRKSFDDVGVGINNSGNGAFVTAVFGSN